MFAFLFVSVPDVYILMLARIYSLQERENYSKSIYLLDPFPLCENSGIDCCKLMLHYVNMTESLIS